MVLTKIDPDLMLVLRSTVLVSSLSPGGVRDGAIYEIASHSTSAWCGCLLTGASRMCSRKLSLSGVIGSWP